MNRVALASVIALACAVPASGASAQQRFSDDFEHGLGAWETYGEGGVLVRDSGDPLHGNVLVLRPHGDVLALIRGSEKWSSVRIEGDVQFPEDDRCYLGVVYNHRRTGDRRDFGVIYIKGNDSYLLANPHRDFNVGRTLYEEFHVDLTGDAAVVIGEWQRFKMEVVGNTCHFYVGDTDTPQMTFPFFELDAGEVGLQPRSVGSDVWVDNVKVSSIRRFSYPGPPRPPGIQYDPEALITRWQVIGPLAATNDTIARDPIAVIDEWRPFDADERGAVVTGRVVDYHGPNTVAYFRTQVVTDESGTWLLGLSTVDDLALWVNGHFLGFIARGQRAWYDFWRNERHEGERVPIELSNGSNEIVLRVRGGVYASGGFYARVERMR